MFVNEYLMNHKRYEKWSLPKFYMLPIFYIYMVFLVLAVVGLWYVVKFNIKGNWITVCALIIFLCIYRGFFVNWMKANKMYRLMRQKYYGDKPWLCRVEIDDKFIGLYVNDKFNNDVHWEQIKKCAVAKSFISLKTDKEGESVMLDKACFIKGNSEEFLEYMRTHHMDIPIVDEDAKYNK